MFRTSASFILALLTGLALAGLSAAGGMPDAVKPNTARAETTRVAAPSNSARVDARPAMAAPAPVIAVNPKVERARRSVGQGADLAAVAAAHQSQRLKLINSVRSWAVQMQDLDVETARNAPVDLIVTDATSGARGGTALSADDVAGIKVKPDGTRRIAISYLSIGESEDYRPEYFDSEYMKEDAPDWLLKENKTWKGNRLIRFCQEGWQRTILGDEDGKSLYSSLEPSPLYRLIELGFDGVYLDRVDVYSEVVKECPDAAAKMVAFVARLAAHARKKNPNFIVILQNAEELLGNPQMVSSIDAIAKEDLFYGVDHSERENDPVMVQGILANLDRATSAGRPVFVLDYIKDPVRRAADKAKIEQRGFIPYFGPRKLDQLWLPSANF